jgi:hypothetical protein
MPSMKKDPLECCLAVRLLLAVFMLLFCLPLLLAGAWAFFTLSVAVVLCLVFFSGKLEYRRLARAEHAFLAERTALSDQEFLHSMGAEPGLACFYLAGRHAMAERDGIPAEMVRPDDTVQSLVALQFDNGFVEDFIFALQEQLQTRLPLSSPANPQALPFGAFLKDLAQHWQRAGRIVLRVDPSRLANPNLALQQALPDVIAEYSHGSIHYDDCRASADNKALLLFLWAERLAEGVACVKEIIENAPVFDNDLHRGVIIAIATNGRYEVVYPANHTGPFDEGAPAG